ncbi:WD40-repeat-containing domain protein, partial [Usnea florida]
GGQMLDVDPVFSQDEKFLLVAYGTSIAVYSISTSLLVRQFHINRADSISAFAVSSTAQDHLYASTINGTIEKWNWIEGLRLGHWMISSSIYSLVTVKQNPDDSGSDLVYTVDRKLQGPWLLSVHRLAGGEDGAKTDAKTLLTNQQALSSIKVLENGRVIVATSGSQLIIGSSEESAPFSLTEVIYRWRMVESPEYIVSTDVRVRPSEKIQKMPKGRESAANAIDIVIGGLKGSIHIYEDLLWKLVQRDRRGKRSPPEIVSRRLHWHRNAAQAVKWSADGNYVISGGQETTLVLWQLETEQRQHLPHLGAAIESVVVSPTGSSYAIRLADNSTMILSTSELRPKFSVAGIQIPVVQQARLPLPFLPSVTAATQKKGAFEKFRRPACVSFSNPGRLLLAVPPATNSKQLSMAPPHASYLQTFDVGASHQFSRQALTRTKVTTLNIGPESNIVEEPNVTHIQTSFDGQWLASVDEWMPPKRDAEPFAFNQQSVLEERVFREEIYLKFWSWNVDTKVWELISRIDNPHASPSGNPYDQGGILDLVSDPSSVAFATVGKDGIVKVWKRAIRRRNGLEVKSRDGRSLTAWHCQNFTSLEMPEHIMEDGLLGANLAYSKDGSILAASFQSSTASPIFIIDTYSGEINSVHTGLYRGPLLGLGIVHKYLITLSDELCVYDLIDDKLNYVVNLPAYGLSPEKRFALSHLAVDIRDSLFAVATPQIEKTGLKSRIIIFDPTDKTPLFTTQCPSGITTLLSAPERKGFYAIDTVAEVRTIRPSQSIPSVSTTLSEHQAASTGGLGHLFGGRQSMLTQGDASRATGLSVAKFGTVTDEPGIEDDGTMVVSQDRLAEVFDVGTYALPPVTQLFEQVARLYSGKAKG